MAGLNKKIILLIILVSYFMIVLDNSIIFTGLPQIQHGLGLDAEGLAWAQNAYTLVFGGLLLLGARAGDILGRRRVFVVGLALFGLASLLVGLAQSAAWIISARALQGLGAAIVAPTSLAFVADVFEAGPERSRATAAYGTTAGLGASAGLVVGGAMSEYLTWRSGFFLNVPIAITMVWLSIYHLPATATERGRFDSVGAILSTLGMAGIVYGLLDSHFMVVLGGMVLLVLFVLNEWKATQPIMPLRLFNHRVRSSAAVVRLLFAGTMIAFFFFTTQLFQEVFGWGALEAGIGFLPMTVIQFAVSLQVPRLAQKYGNSVVLLAGFLSVTVGMVWLAFLQPTSTYLSGVVGPLVLLGLGQGLGFGPLTAVGIIDVEKRNAGAASGMVNTAHQLGSTLGVAVLTALAAHETTQVGHVIAAYRGGAVMVAMGLVLVAVFISTDAGQTVGRRIRLYGWHPKNSLRSF